MKRLPHEFQENKLCLGSNISRYVVEDLGGMSVIRCINAELSATFEFDGEIVPTPARQQFLSELYRIAGDGIMHDEHPADYLKACKDFVESASIYMSTFDWWTEIKERCEISHPDIDSHAFDDPPKDVVSVVADNNPHLSFTFFNFGDCSFIDSEISSLERVVAEMIKGVDLTHVDAGNYSFLLIPSGAMFLDGTPQVTLASHGLFSAIGREEFAESRGPAVEALRHAMFGVEPCWDSTAALPSIICARSDYDGLWGIKMPSRVTFNERLLS